MTEMIDLSTVEPIREHPAKFNTEILSMIAAQVRQHSNLSHTPLLDPFGGIGGIHDLKHVLADFISTTYAIELQPGWAATSARRGWTYVGDLFEFSPRMSQFQYVGGSRVTTSSPPKFGIVATSCTYGNRMADKHIAREDSKRLTYAHTLRRNGEEMDSENSGGMQWGEAYREFHVAAWWKVSKLTEQDGLFILNVKDHVRKGKLQRVPEWHRDTVLKFGFEQVADIHVPVNGMGFGQNQTLNEGAKVDYEHIYTFRRK